MRQTFAQDIAPQLRSAIFSSGLSAKLICLFCLLGYCLSYSSQCVRALTVIPGRLMPPNFWIWTFVTHSFIELHVWHTLIDVIVVFLYAKMIEPLWGSRELVKFYFIVTIPNALVAASTYILCYGLTFNEEYLFERPIYGLASFIGAFTVVIKQIMPETVLANTPFFKLRQDHVPLLIVLLSTILWLASLVPLHFLIMLTFGIAVSWIYLRFFQPHSNGTAGDMSSSFSCSSFFPPVIAPVVSVLANTIFEIFVKLKLCKPMPKKPLIPTTGNLSVTIPGPDAADADRRRQKALKALNDRMKLEKAGVDSWPEMDDPSQTPLLPSTHSNAPTSVTIEMSKDNLNQSSTSSSSST